MSEHSEFIFVICQTSATVAARQELARLPNLNLSFSQPGFITFKVDQSAAKLPERFTLPATLARTYGWMLGKTSDTNAQQMVEQVLARPELVDCKNLHVFEREKLAPGQKGFEPGISLLAAEVAGLFQKAIASTGNLQHLKVNKVAQPDEKVFDVVLVEPNEWWFGFHHAINRPLRWVGGVPIIDTTHEVVSRAYFKLKDALLWSGVSIHPDEVVAEVGSAPGGACQLLLEMGNKVIAIDPGEMDEELLENPNLTHYRKRGREVRKKDLKDVKWLLSDLNMVPNFALDVVEEMVGNEHLNVCGLILTLKLIDWKLVEEIPAYIKRVKKMGFSVVKARQLAFNRQEFCLVAVKDKFELRRRKSRPPRPKKK